MVNLYIIKREKQFTKHKDTVVHNCGCPPCQYKIKDKK